MDETTWMELALERKDTLDKINKIVTDLIYDLHFMDDDEGLLYEDVMDQLGKIQDLSDEDAKW